MRIAKTRPILTDIRFKRELARSLQEDGASLMAQQLEREAEALELKLEEARDHNRKVKEAWARKRGEWLRDYLRCEARHTFHMSFESLLEKIGLDRTDDLYLARHSSEILSVLGHHTYRMLQEKYRSQQ